MNKSIGVRKDVASLGVLHTLNENINTEVNLGVQPLTQYEQRQSIGGLLMGTSVLSYGQIYKTQLANVVILDIFEDTKGGEVRVRALDSDNVVFIDSDGNTGDPLPLTVGEEILVVSSDRNKGVLLTRLREGSVDQTLGDELLVDLQTRYNTALVGNDVTEAQLDGGYYASLRCLGIKNLNENDRQLENPLKPINWMSCYITSKRYSCLYILFF